MKKFIFALCLLVIASVWGIVRFDHLAERPINPIYFTDYNKAEITAGYLAMMIVGYPLYPEISKEIGRASCRERV